MAGLKGALSEGTRCIANIFQIRFSRYVKNAMNHTKTVLTANSMTANILKSIYNINPIVQIEIGLNNISENNTPNNIGNLKILWSGVFEHRKALHLLMMALSNLPDYVHYELHVLGKGQVEKRWRNIADKLGITKNIRWLGWLPHKEALEQFKWANVFVFTSLRDTTGTVVLEAISNGLPVICLDHQGAADIVTNECGIKVAVTNPAGAIKGLRDALVLLHDDKEKRMALAIGALARAKDFLWENQVEVFKDIYSNAIKITDGVYVN
jgi:glycosyltransferase involved in cell wall biosynthesis